MKYLITLLFILTMVGCQSQNLTASPSPPGEHAGHEHDGHDDEKGHEDHEAGGVLKLTEAQKKQVAVRSKAVVAASGQGPGVRPGRIEANPDSQVVVSSQVSGTLQQLYAQVGGEVAAGGPIGVISSPEVTALQAEYHEAEVEAELARKELANKTELFRVGDDIQRPLETAKLEVAQARAFRDAAAANLRSAKLKNERLETLLKEGIASRQQVEESRANKQALEADLEQTGTALKIAVNHLKRETRVSGSQLRIKAETFPAEARLSRASEQMRHTKRRLEQLGASPHGHDGLMRLYSPISGTVVERPRTRGELVKNGETIALIVDSSKVWVWVDLQRSDLKVVEQGDPIVLSLADDATQTAEGHLDFVSPQVDKGSQTVRARVVLESPPAEFRMGSFVNARVSNGSGKVSPSIPQKAVQFVEGQTVVYVAKDGGYVRTPVTLGAEVGEGLVSVKGVGIGDQVVVDGVEQLKSLDLSDKIGGHSH